MTVVPRALICDNSRMISQGERAQRPGPYLRPGRPDHAQGKGHVVVRCAGRQEFEILEDHTQPAPQQRHAATTQAADVPPVDDHPSGGGEFITVHEAQERGLAGAGRPNHKNKLPRLNAEGDMAERYDTVEKSLCDVLKLDHALLRRIPYQFAWPTVPRSPSLT